LRFSLVATIGHDQSVRHNVLQV